jgi:hypothetical protein
MSPVCKRRIEQNLRAPNSRIVTFDQDIYKIFATLLRSLVNANTPMLTNGGSYNGLLHREERPAPERNIIDTSEWTCANYRYLTQLERAVADGVPVKATFNGA